MSNHHPDDNLLTEYAGGSIAEALGLIICAHLQTCPHCRKRVEHLNKLGATILTNSVAEVVQPETFEQLMARIRAETSDAPSPVKATKLTKPQEVHAAYANDPLLKHLPKVITKLLPRDGKLKWERVSKGLKSARLVTGQQQYEVIFQRITSGNKVVEHDHRGLE
ncbi:MAG: hypothetical protein EOO68_15755, partial [Moraxellaceae bacterium]